MKKTMVPRQFSRKMTISLNRLSRKVTSYYRTERVMLEDIPYKKRKVTEGGLEVKGESNLAPYYIRLLELER